MLLTHVQHFTEIKSFKLMVVTFQRAEQLNGFYVLRDFPFSLNKKEKICIETSSWSVEKRTWVLMARTERDFNFARRTWTNETAKRNAEWEKLSAAIHLAFSSGINGLRARIDSAWRMAWYMHSECPESLPRRAKNNTETHNDIVLGP